jgi:hypothetical protein
MLGRLGFAGATVITFAASCGGHSDVVGGPTAAAAGKTATTHSGAGGKLASAGSCSSCGGRGGSEAAVGGGGQRAGRAGAASGGAGAVSDAAGEAGGGRAGEAGQGGETSAGGGTSEGGMGGDAVSNAGMGGEGLPPAMDTLAISKVAVYQATEVTVFANGAAVEPNAPVVANREALVRVWVKPAPVWTGRSITGELDVTAGSSSRVAKAVNEVSAASTDGELASTFTFPLRANEVTATAKLSVTLREANGIDPLVRWPESIDFTLGAQSSKGNFLVTLVPLVASGHTPDLGTETVARFQRYLSHVYPAADVDMSVRAAVTFAGTLAPDGTGWDDALDTLLATRDADAPAANVYYYGVVTPAATYSQYCVEGCIVGLSNVAGPDEDEYRGAIGTGYFVGNADTSSPETMAHELGHALGRDHAPCGDPDDPDVAYPYHYGQIGVRGYDGKSLLDPDTYKDEMSYCVPVWISDYTWSGLFDRISYVNGGGATLRAVGAAPAAQRYRTLVLRADGSLHWGHERALTHAPGGAPATLELLDASGGVIDVVAASFAPFDHVAGGFLNVLAAALDAPGVASVRVNGAVLRVR